MKTVACPKCEGTGKIIDHAALGLELRQMRLKAGVSLRHMAFRLQITPPYLSDLELGKRSWHDPRIRDFKTVCKIGTKPENNNTKGN